MQSLAEVQDSFARAMTTGDTESFRTTLVGGRQPRNRLAIHLRHYETSLTTALADKFPAAAWLAGADLLRDAARAYVRLRPPLQPCIAEYGADFPQFIAGYERAASVPYLASFAALEWAVGRVSIAAERAPCSWAELSRRGTDRLLDSALALQPGLRYVRSRWRIDELMTAYLSGAAPARFVLVEEDTHIEVRGARGDLRIARLDSAAFVFRSALADGRSIGVAAADALERDPAFDAGEALRSLAHAALVVDLSAGPQESSP